MKNTLKKRVSFAFGKTIYLLGSNTYGEKFWLEAPSWDCGWYWGFGYVETYTNNNDPSKAKDITSHQHIDGDGFLKNKDNLYFAPYLSKTTFTKIEGKELANLFNQFYALKKEAEAIYKTDVTRGKEINETLIPETTSKILAILS